MQTKYLRTCYTERRKTKREAREAAIAAMLADMRMEGEPTLIKRKIRVFSTIHELNS
jgi:hypothetical protein